MTFVRNDHIGKLLLRLTLGLLMLLHGIGKLVGGVGGIQGLLANAGLPGFLAFGVYLGEIVGPLMVIIGWYCGIGALLIVINMVFAIYLAHTHEIFQLTQSWGWAIELQVFYLMTAVVLILTGPGRISLNGR